MQAGLTDAPRIRRISAEQAGSWLAAGWRDMTCHPRLSLGFGAVFAAIGALLALALVAFDLGSLLLPVASSFTLVGPLGAICLYEISRRIERGEPVSLAAVWDGVRARGGQIANMGLVLTLALVAWLMAGMVIFALFRSGSPPPLDRFVVDVLLDPQSLPFLLAGTLCGGAIAAATFSISVFAMPMLLDRDVSPATAMAASVRAVRLNWPAMIGWAATIAVVVGFGIVTLFAGLVVCFPLLAHASWHAYRDVIG